MSNSSQELTKVVWAHRALWGHFRLMGGAARYPGFSESDVPLYIACQLAKQHSLAFEPMDYVDPEFVEAASPVLEQVHSHLELVSAQGNELAGLIYKFVNFANSRLEEHVRSYQWDRFSEWTKRTYAQPIIPPDAAR